MELEGIRLSKFRETDEYKLFYSNVVKLATTIQVSNNEYSNVLLSKIVNGSLDFEFKNLLLKQLKKLQLQNGNSLLTLGVRRSKAQLTLVKVQSTWEKRLLKSLINLAKEQGKVMVKLRNERDMHEMDSKWNELSSWDTDLSSYKPLYGPKDLFDLLKSLKESQNLTRLESKWSVVVSGLEIPLLSTLKKSYLDYLKEGLSTEWTSSSLFVDDIELRNRVLLGKAVGMKNHAPAAEEFCKSRCPSELRRTLWTQILDCHVSSESLAYFEDLRDSIIRNDLLVDKLILKDVRSTSTNDEHYFIFEDLLYKVMLSLTRDSEFNRLSKSEDFRKVASSPSGIMPCYGISMYAAPLCYVYNDAAEIYFALKAMYIKYWYSLHYLDESSSGIVCLATLFERVLQSNEPHLWTHFLGHGINALQIALPWIVRAFSGYLPVCQVLSLWDIILGHDSLQILPVLAAAIFSLRRHALLNISSQHCAEIALADLSTIRVFPLLYMAFENVT